MNNESQVIHGTSIKFETLKNENITSQQLYLLYAPIDVVERYEAFLQSSNESLSTQVFYNCSIPWFGEFCQYTFNSILSFDDYVDDSLRNSKFPFNNGTCYTFMKCNRGSPPSCLDWREICDGKIDCLDGGTDELACDELESNECTNDEFRCNNGVCVPKEFFNDDQLNCDCIDCSDESQLDGYEQTANDDCYKNPAFRCEETACQNERMLSCGDGQCKVKDCDNQRNIMLRQAKLSWNANLHLSYDCWESLICLTVTSDNRISLFGSMECGTKDVSERRIREKCPTLIFFPAQPIVLGRIRVVYANNLTNKYNLEDDEDILLPEYVCYDQQFCESFPSTIWINDSTCRSWSQLNLDKPFNNFENVESRTLELFLKCSTTKNSYIQCPKSKPYRCANSSKCLPLNRLLDGFSDCFEGDDERIKDSCSLPDKHYRFRCSTENKCIPINSIKNNEKACTGQEDWKNERPNFPEKAYILTFQILCDGFVDHNNLDGFNYTDEMDCEHWPCINVYTRCNSFGVWNSPNGIDETNCPDNLCAPDSHPCILLHSYKFICLPSARINDVHIDCGWVWVLMFVMAIINGALSIITFQTKGSLQLGCGLYLLASSITSCLTMTMFVLKFLLLVLSQLSMITNYSFLLINCILMDMFLKSFLAIGDWLTACVAVERVVAIHVGVKFNKTKSKKVAKWIIFGVYLLTLKSYIHDPVHRDLLEDKEEERKWCVVHYSSPMQVFASFINIIHFILPFSINVIAILFIIILMARQKLKVNGQETFKEHLWKQFHQHKHRLFSSFILIIIATPRLIISFIS